MQPTIEQLAKAVREMRYAQISFFRNRKSKMALNKSIQLEKKVDDMIKEIPEPSENYDYSQLKIF